MHEHHPSSRSLFDALLRLALTLVVVVILWMGIRFVFLVHRLSDNAGYSPERFSSILSPEAVRVEDIAEKRARFPLPLFPGAQAPEFGEMEFNGHPFARCDYDVSATPQEVLFFYRDQLKARGWRDTTEDAIRQAAISQQAEEQGMLDFQNETFLRFYDHMMKTQATFSRDGGHVQVAVEPGALSWSTRVGVMYVEYGAPEELSTDLQRSLGGGGPDQPFAGPATFAQNLGGQHAETTILTSRQSPGDFRNDLMLQYRDSGWKELDVGPPGGSEGSDVGGLIKEGGQMVFLNVTYDPEQEVSRAIITKMGPR